ncbi:MAG: ribonuclease R family protein, partial [Myxococcota bacterium]
MSRRDRKRGQRGKPAQRRGRRRSSGAPPAAPDRERVLRVLAGRGRPLRSLSEILRSLGLGRDSLRPLRAVLKELEAEGALERVAGRCRLTRRDGLAEGTFRPALSGAARGGEVIEDGGAVWRVAEARDVRAGDRVIVLPLGDPARRRGEILDLLEGQRSDWVGVFHRRGRGGVVTPYRDDADWAVEIAAGEMGGARDGDVVVAQPARPARRPARGPRSRSQRARSAGRVVEVLGPPGHPDADFRAVVWRRRLRVAFPEAVTADAAALPAELSPAEIARRVDLRDRPFLTIDPATARDHDDALCVEESDGGGFRLWVAIADVSHFVAEGSAIDREALRRGNSVYFPDRAIPMLPERLSGDLCSLRPDVDRGVLVVELDVARDGRVTRANFYPAVIRSRARLAYEQAAPAVDGGGDGGFAPEIARQLRSLGRVTAGLRRRRAASGSIDLDLPEPELAFGPEGKVIDVVASPRTAAHRAVEDAMLAANRAVAELLAARAQPAVFRNHDPPAPKKVEALLDIFETFGLDPDGLGAEARRGDGAPVPPPSWIACALERVAGRPEERLVHQLVLRCMSRAQYGAAWHGHYALAFRHYTHFTSPIRRYADLVVHRSLVAVLDAGDRPAPAPDAALRRQRAGMQRVAG